MNFPIAPVLALIALAMAPASLSAADLRDMKVLQNDGGTQAVLELQGTSAYKLFTLENPRRLVLDLSQARLAPGFRLPAPNGSVIQIRTGQPQSGTLRVVFELGESVTTSSHVERESGATRLVIALNNGAAIASGQTSAGRAVDSLVESSLYESAVPVAASSAPSATQAAVADALPLATFVAPVVTDSPRPPSQSPAAVAATQPVTPAEISSPRVALKTLRDVVGTGQRKLVVAIDAGHGGKDPGALGPSGVREKAVTLAVARELARQINNDPGMRAVLIRDGDSFVPLKQRYMKARSAQADLFISIHADASPNNSASGASVFVLSTRGASSQAARWLADQENAADLVGGVSLDHKDHNLAAVLLDLSQSATMRASDDIANQVLDSLKNVGKAHKPSIERANFVVLRSPDVPSMLIETGFITNPAEEQRLNDPGYRTRLAAAISNGVRKYFSDQAPPGSWYASREETRPASRLHVVSRGETLSLIAARHGVGVERIRQANRRHGDSVRVGESLTIPLMAAAPK